MLYIVNLLLFATDTASSLSMDIPRTSTAALHWLRSLQKAFLILFLLLLLDLQPALHFATARTSKKQLHKVSRRSRVKDSYFVHVKPEVSWEDAEDLMQELQTLDYDSERPQFKATVQGAITQLGYGFGAELSQQALEKVSMLFHILLMLFLFRSFYVFIFTLLVKAPQAGWV